MSRNRPYTQFPCNEQGLVDNFIGTAYDTVKKVYDHLDEIKRLDDVLEEIPGLAQISVDNALAISMPPIIAEVSAYADAAEASAEAAAQSALEASKVSLMFPFTYTSTQLVYDVTVIAGRTDVTTAGLALWVEGAIEYDFTILSGTTFTLNDPSAYPENAQMRIIVNARFDDLIQNFADLQDSFEQTFQEFLDKSGFEVPVPYVAGLTLVRPTQTVSYLGRDYRVKLAYLPLTTTNWEADSPKMVLVGEGTIRKELAEPDGVVLVGGATVNLDAIADLRAFKGRRSGDKASILSVGSGWAINVAYPFPSGGGEFRWEEGSTTPVVEGMVEQVVGSATGRWKRIFSGAVHITWTGAVPDGFTKSSAKVQLALDNYTTVYIPPGKFLMDSFSTHTFLYTPTVMTCAVKITPGQKCVELYGEGEASQLVSEFGVRYVSIISQYNVKDRSIHSFSMDGLYDRSGSTFMSSLSGIRQQSVQRCSIYNMKITNFAYHCLALYGGSHVVDEPACLWNKYEGLYLDGGGQSTLLIYSAEWVGLTLPNEYNEFSNVFAMNSHVYFGVEVRKSNNNKFINLTTNSNQKGGVNLEEGSSYNKFTNLTSKFNGYGLHMVSNNAGDIIGNQFLGFDLSDNRVHNVLAFMGARENTFAHGTMDRAGTGNGWRSEDTSSYGNYFLDVKCRNNTGEGLLFQNDENLTDVVIGGNGLRGITISKGSKLRRVISTGNGTDAVSLSASPIDAEDCYFGPKHTTSSKVGVTVGKFIEMGQAGMYSSGSGTVPVEIVNAGSFSKKVWRSTVKEGKIVSIPTYFFAGSGFTTLRVSLRLQTDGPIRQIQDISGTTAISVPANTDWIWVNYDIAISSLTAASVLNLRYYSETAAGGFVQIDGYRLSLI